MLPYIIAGAIGFVVAKLFEEDETPKYVDGGSVLLAPNGKPSKLTPEQYELVRTPEFKAWFGDWEKKPKKSSKVIDIETKEPLVLYHGTNSDFTIFDTDEDSENREGGTWDADYPDGYIFMISDKKQAKQYGSRVIPLFVNMTNPTIVKVDRGESLVLPFDDEGLAYEGNAIVTNGIDYVVGTMDEYIIKLADGSNTTFDAGNPDIRFELGGKVEKKNKINIYIDNITDSAFFKSSYGTFRDGYNYIDVIVNMVNKEYGYSKMKGKFAVISIGTEEIEGRSPNKKIFNTKDEAIFYIINKLTDENNKYADGGSVLLAPNGKRSNLTPEQYKLVRTPEFKAWFGDWENDSENASKVVDENGEPLVVWRGESKDFNVFEYKKLGSSLKTAWRNAGFYFSPTKSGAEQYMFFMGSGILKQFFLNIKNPYTFDSKEFFGVMDWGSLPTQRFKTNKSATDYANSKVEIIKNDNYDGFFVTILEDENVVEIVAFEPEQIKLADGTNTTFDGNNPDIRYAGGGSISTPKNVQIKIFDEQETYFNSAIKNQKNNDVWMFTKTSKSKATENYETTNVFQYKNYDSMLNSAKRIANDKSTITIYDEQGKGKKYLLKDYFNNPDIRFAGGGNVNNKTLMVNDFLNEQKELQRNSKYAILLDATWNNYTDEMRDVTDDLKNELIKKLGYNPLYNYAPFSNKDSQILMFDNDSNLLGLLHFTIEPQKTYVPRFSPSYIKPEKIFENNDNVFYIEYIFSFGKGNGQKMMNQIKKYANKYNVAIGLEGSVVEKSEGKYMASAKHLKRFYDKQGFVNTDGNYYLYSPNSEL